MNLTWVENCLAEIASGTGMTFGHCSQCGQFTPADVDAGPEGVFASCMLCRSDRQRGYRFGGDIPLRYVQEYERLLNIEYQIMWLSGWLTMKRVSVEAAHAVLLDESADLVCEKADIGTFQMRLTALRESVTS